MLAWLEAYQVAGCVGFGGWRKEYLGNWRLKSF